MILLSGGSKSCHRGAGLVRNLLFSTKTRASIAQVPGILKALRKLQTSNDSDTQQRSTIALSMLIEYQQESGMLACHCSCKRHFAPLLTLQAYQFRARVR